MTDTPQPGDYFQLAAGLTRDEVLSFAILDHARAHQAAVEFAEELVITVHELLRHPRTLADCTSCGHLRDRLESVRKVRS